MLQKGTLTRVAEGIPTQVLKHLGMTPEDAKSLVKQPTGYIFNGSNMISMNDLKSALDENEAQISVSNSCVRLGEWNVTLAPNVAPHTPTTLVRRPGCKLDNKGRFTLDQDEMMRGQIEMLGTVLQISQPSGHAYIKNGLISMECGTGKTRAAATIAYLSAIDRGWPVVYVTYSEESYPQICDDFSKCNIVNIAKIDSTGACSLYDVVTREWNCLHNIDDRPQMLLMTYTVANILRNRYMKAQIPDIALAMMCLLKHGNNGVMILDEVHRCAARDWRKILEFAKVKVRIGMSATLLREDDGISMLQEVIGPVLLDYTRANVPVHYELVNVPHDNRHKCNRFKIWQLYMRLKQLPPLSRSMVFCDSTEQLTEYYSHMKTLLTVSNEGERLEPCEWDVVGPIDNSSESKVRELCL